MSETLVEPWISLIETLSTLQETDPGACIERAQGQADRAEAAGHTLAAAQILCFTGFARGWRGESALALADFERALALAQSTGSARWTARALHGLGTLEMNLGNAEAALERHEQALALRRQIGDAVGEASTLNNLANAYCALGRLDEAQRLYSESAALCERGNDPRGVAIAWVNIARMWLSQAAGNLLGDPAAATPVSLDEVLGFALRARDLCDQHDAERVAINARLTAADAYLRLGQIESAWGELQVAVAQLGQHSLPGEDVECTMLTARLLAARGETHTAVEKLAAALTAAEALGETQLVIDVLTQQVLLHESRGDPASALVAFKALARNTLTLRARVAEQRGQRLQSQLRLERAQHQAALAEKRALELNRLNAELSRRAEEDALTGLLNRRGLTERGGADRRAAYVVLADIDHFKSINDRYGHGVGDLVLQHVARVLRAGLRDTDWSARYGGEEFLLVLPGVDESAARVACERLRKAVVASSWQDTAPELAVSMSFGVAHRPEQGSLDAAIAAADDALYAAKRGGRNQVVFACRTDQLASPTQA